MKNILNLDKGLSIQELEERFELTVATSSEFLEADKPRCGRVDFPDQEIKLPQDF